MSLDLAYRCAKVIAWVTIPVFGRFEVVGLENLPRTGGVILAANHQSNADPPVLFLALPRALWFMGKEGLFRNRIVAYFLRILHVFPVGRGGRDVEAANWALGVLRQGRGLVIFPEATRRPRGMGPGTEGLAFLAARSGVPVVPIGITGTEHMTTLLRIPFPLCRIRIVVGEPLSFSVPEGRLPRDELKAMTDTIMRRIAALLPPEYRGLYADPPPPTA